MIVVSNPGKFPTFRAATLFDDKGATTLEYAVLASLIVAVAVFGIRNLGLTVGGLFDRAVTQMGIF